MATVAFTVNELQELIRRYVGGSEVRQAARLIRAFQSVARPRGNELRRLMDLADKVLDGSGVETLFGREGRVVTDPWDAQILAEYVNLGDTYSQTILYDYESNEFRLWSWGDYVENWEGGQPVQAEEDVCVSCGQQFDVEELEYDEDGTGATCRNCSSPPLSVWYPDRTGNPPLVAMLRSVEGDEVAVHFWDDRPIGLAFSVPLGHGSFSARQIKGRSSDEPYVEAYEELFKRFQAGASHQVVADVGRSVSIEREMFQHLRVAMDAFVETGGERQPMKAFLKTPPVLWTCGQIDHIQWSEGERGDMGPPDAVEAYVGDYMEPDALSVWAASGRELRELIEDGFIAWKRDDTVRAYLKQIGVCR